MPATPLNAERRVTRRDFLHTLAQAVLAVSGLAALGGVLRFLGYQSAPGLRTEFDLGPATDLPPGARRFVPEASAIVISTANGLTALSLICPHLGCTVNAAVAGFTCPCHGSQFDPQGQLVRGPAETSLRPLLVSIDEHGHLILRTTSG